MTTSRFLSLQALFLALALLAACSRTDVPVNSGQANTGPLRVVVTPVEEIPQHMRIEAVGTSRAMQSITLYPASAGEVVAVHFEPGQAVKKGQLLLELDRRNEELAVELAKVRLADAERLFQRYQRSAESGATLPTTLDAAETALEEARIALQRARIALADRYVRAPFAGYVGLTDIDPGDRIQTNTPITTLDNRSSLLVSFEVPELLVGNLNTGDKVAVSTWNSRRPAAYGEVVDIDSRINPSTRTFLARARVDNSNDSLRPGQSFRVTMELVGDLYPVVPEVAVQWGIDGAYVWTLPNNLGQRVPVNIVQRQEGLILLDGPITPGELVIIEGTQRMRPNLEVLPQLGSPATDVGATTPTESSEGPG